MTYYSIGEISYFEPIKRSPLLSLLALGSAGAAIWYLNRPGEDVMRNPKRTSRCWAGYEPVPGKKPYSKGSCRKIRKNPSRRRNPIPERYKRMGFTKVGQKKKSTSKGKKWMVLAKKGDKYKVVHGGYKGMKDYSQHKDKDRRKAFWDRMGGKNSAKARDPFSPLYWHKKFGTW